MFKINRPDEIKLKENFIMLIYGKPGIGKTTTALSSKNPILLDFEGGMDRVPGNCWVPNIQVNNFDDIMEFVNSDAINEFDTIVIDTMEKLVEKITNKVLADDPRLRMRNGNLHLQAYGAIKFLVKDLLRVLNMKCKNLIFVAHSEERENEKKEKEIIPCMGPGSGGREVINATDIMCFMDKVSNESVLRFSSSDVEIFTKNSLHFPEMVKIPNPEIVGQNTFLQELIEKYKHERIENIRNMQEEYKTAIKDMDSVINNIDCADTCTSALKYFQNESKFKKIEIWRQKLWDKAKSLNLAFNTESREFENVCDNAIAV